MALIWTIDQREIKVEISAARVEQECHKVAASRFPVVELKLAGRDEMIRINAEHIVSIKNHADDVPDE
jgi:hypothetical protein